MASSKCVLKLEGALKMEGALKIEGAVGDETVGDGLWRKFGPLVSLRWLQAAV